MKTILVLGGFGFIGSNLLHQIDAYQKEEYQVILFDKKDTHNFGLEFKCVKKIYAGDFTNKNDIQKIFDENHIDEVFHFLNTTVPATSGDIKFDIESNLLSTINLLEIIVLHHVKKIVFISSGGAIYSNVSSENNTESVDAFPLSSYGIMKLAIEKYIYMFCVRSGISFLILRLSNPYGKFHYSEKQGIVNVALRKALKNETVTVWGEGKSKKDYIFIDDFINVLFILLNKDVHNEIINVGSGQLYSVTDILCDIKKFEPGLIWQHIDQKDFDNADFELNMTKLRLYIGDYKFITLPDGIQQTLEWLKNRNKVINI